MEKLFATWAACWMPVLYSAATQAAIVLLKEYFFFLKCQTHTKNLAQKEYLMSTALLFLFVGDKKALKLPKSDHFSLCLCPIFRPTATHFACFRMWIKLSGIQFRARSSHEIISCTWNSLMNSISLRLFYAFKLDSSHLSQNYFFNWQSHLIRTTGGLED